jgi:hypothetical protein
MRLNLNAARMAGALLLALAFGSGCTVRWAESAGSDTKAHRGASRRNCAAKSYKIDRDRCWRDQQEEDAAQADWAQKQKQFDEAFADEIAAFRALEPALKQTDGASTDLADKAEELRTRFVKRCIAESGWSTAACWDGTFARDISTALVAIRLKQGDMASAAAEAFTLRRRDLRSTDAKIWKIHGLNCGNSIFAGRPCSSDAKGEELSPELFDLTLSSSEHDRDVEWRGRDEIASMTKTRDAAVFTFKPEGGGSSDARSCGDPEWRTNSAGNEVLVRPCEMHHFVSKRFVFPPATVPLSEVGDFKVSKDTGALVVFATKGKHAGHVLETWVNTHKTAGNGGEVLQILLFRGTPMRDANPGFP